ncbi:PREDICTED: two-component response regulator-like APRR3 isoform X2 [Lupinus angustifolius]|uniref:two-component response regulator-like APRR3 isoform X2 n=1 Tax=Lupinus angustifolius TaxID=3871 RepID=UPI00092E74DE|nr:PREDICTED: two-component response regulator-like APRR3 isoform X2 [Lupinus angustifolius]
MNNNVRRGGFSEHDHILFDRKGPNHGVLNGGLGSGASTEDDTRSNKAVEIHQSFHISQQPPKGRVVGWERFLPLRSIKVLLVEDDDSTRHIVCALLRNCSYEVTAVSNGLQAWRALGDPGNHIDLVLTEVAMPILSGIGLLLKIMNHRTLKNIPVIMMSSHDAMGIVFKCLSKGAADFLVKPIRRNELKNLWQHVWRRCHSVSCFTFLSQCSGSVSGSESGTYTRKSSKSRSNDAPQNSSDSCDENDHGNRSVQDGSDNGSGTQSSWTKCVAQVGSPHPASTHTQFVEATDSTCAQVIHTKPEKLSSRWAHATEKERHELIDDHLDNAAMGKDLAIGISLNIQMEQPLELSSKPIGIFKMSDVDGKQLDEGHSNVCKKGQPEYNIEKTRTQEDQAMNAVDVADSSNRQAESRDLNSPYGFFGFSQTKASCNFKQYPSLELTLKSLEDVRDAKNDTVDECNVLRHSDLSAFSRYNTASSANQTQTGNLGRCSPLYNSSMALNTDTAYDFPSHSNGTPPNQQSNGSNNRNDIASTNTYLSTKPETFDQDPESVRGVGLFNSSALQTLQNNSISPSQKKNCVQEESAETIKGQVRCSEQVLQVKHSYYKIHHYNHIAHKATPDKRSDPNDPLLKSLTTAAKQCVSSNVLGGPSESNSANFDMNGNAIETDHGRNRQDGSSNTLAIRAINVENGNVTAGIGVGGIDGRNIGNGVDEGRIALREAALTKFRQKRKERCFDKKVRYHSRKKLAEQRPRIRGQFVRHILPGEEKDKQCNMVSADNSSSVPQ